MDILHIPVLLDETIVNLQVKEGDVVIDCTVGEGGHSSQILKVIGPSGFLYGMDRDEESLRKAKIRLSKIGTNFALINNNFANIKEISEEHKFMQANKILADLGLSSLQLYYERRGFSFMKDGPLDMRMDAKSDLAAADVVNSFPEEEIADIIYKFGEERFSRRIAKAIIKHRKIEKIKTTQELANIVISVYPHGNRRIHPATKTFQALRIFVNSETENLAQFLKDAPDLIGVRGRIAIISYHSLEDRAIKQAFRSDVRLKRINKKVIVPQMSEIHYNRRARSAKLRVAERI